MTITVAACGGGGGGKGGIVTSRRASQATERTETSRSQVVCGDGSLDMTFGTNGRTTIHISGGNSFTVAESRQ